MQFRISESQLALESIDKSLIFLAKLEKCILPSFQEFLIWGIPRFGNSRNEGSLVLGIPETRDPSFWEFPKRGIPHFRNSEPKGSEVWNKQVLLVVLFSFLSHFLLLGFFMYMTQIFWKDIGPGLLFLVARSTFTKFRHSTGVTTANSTNKNPNANRLSWAIN